MDLVTESISRLVGGNGPLSPLVPSPLPTLHAPTTPGRRPSVSIVVPCYKYGHYLPYCVASLLEQPGVEVDVLIVDDASPDDSGEVAEQLADRHDNVELLRHTTNRGHIQTYNDGLARARGDYVVLLSADDLLTPGALERSTSLMEAFPSVGLVYGHLLELTGEELPSARTTASSWSVWDGPEWIRTMCLSSKSNVTSPEVVMRTSVHREIGLYRSDLPHSGDMEMWMRAAAVADVGRVNGADQAYYRVHPDSMFRTQYGVELADLIGRRQAFDVAFTEGPAARLADVSEMHRVARRRLAVSALQHASRVLDTGAYDADPVDQYIEFALDVFPAAPGLRQWRSLQRRRMLGDETVADHRSYQLRERSRQLADRARWRLRRRCGL